MKAVYNIDRMRYMVHTYSVSKLVDAPNWGVDKNFIPMSKVEYVYLMEMFGGPGFSVTGWQQLKEGEAHCKVEQGDVIQLKFVRPVGMATAGRLTRVWKKHIRGEWKAREVY